MSQGDGDIENGDGVSHKEGGLKIEFNWEKQENNHLQSFCKFSII